MRWLFASLALLSAMPAHAESRVRSRLSTHRQPTGDAAAVYRFVGTADGTWDPSFSRLARPTVTGPATTVDRGDGTAATVPANTLAVGPDGALIYGARTSRILWNQALDNAAWVKRGAAACVPSPEPDPLGTYTAWRCTVGAVNVDDFYQGVLGHSASAGLSTSAWIHAVSESGIVSVDPTGSGTGSKSIDLSAAAIWTKFSWSGLASAVGASGMKFSSGTGAAITFDLWRPWQVEGSDPGPDAEVQSAPLSVAATAVSAPNALRGSEWCVRIDATPGSHWRSGAVRYLVAIGTSGADRAYIRVDGNGKLQFTVIDETTTARYIFTDAPADSTEHTITACADGGTLALWVDGERLSVSSGGTGSGVITSMPTTVAIGSNGTSDHWGGSIRSVTLCNTADPARCRQ